MSWLTDLTSEQKQRSALGLQRLKAWAAIACLMAGTAPSYALGYGMGQQTSATAQGDMPSAPQPHFTEPLYLRPSKQNFSRARGYFPNLIGPYLPINVAPGQNYLNALTLGQLLRGGKIYLSLSDAILLALENNYDIAIQRVNLNIADTDILRARAGSNLFGVNSGLVTGTLGGSTASVNSVGGGPGGTTSGAGGAGAGAEGLALTANGSGPTPENLDPTLQAQVQLNRVKQPQQNILFSGGLPAINTNTDQYNFTYNQGFVSGTGLQVTFDNSRITTNNPFDTYSPTLLSTFNAQITQNLLQGFGPGINGRFIVQAKNDRRIADSAFRAQLLYTINQVENIYWGLVSAYEDVAAKQRAAQQSANLVKDDEKQLQVGAIAPLDLVNVKSQHAADEQALITAQSTLEYQQMLMKQAISRNLDNAVVANAPVIPTDRVNLAETPEELKSINQLVREADQDSPSIEQATLALKNDRITLKADRNGLLPTVQLYAFYGAQGIGGAVSPYCNTGFFGKNICNQLPSTGYSTVFTNLFNSTGPNKGAGVNITIPIRNRTAQALESRSRLEYEQEQMRLQQLYVQTRMQVINGQYALTNDRAAVRAAIANRNYNQQSLDAEIKKLHLGAATTADVLQQERNLAAAEATLISDTAKYATDRAALSELLGITLDRYGISIVDAATGQISTPPIIPGIEPASTMPEVNLPAQKQQLKKQQKERVPQPEKPAPGGMPQHSKS
ncbi:MAG: TolC family protein [Acidobacteria bacterium]|nr:TolC family protein [Acidobacteriota bacterium]